MAKKKNRTKKILLKIFITIILIVIIVGLINYDKIKYYFYGLESTGNKIEFYVHSKDKLDDVIERLYEKKIIKDKKIFKNYSIARNYNDNTVEAGKYVFYANYNYYKIINDLRQGNGEVEVSVNFDNCVYIEDLAERITSNLEITKQEFLKKINDNDEIAKYGFDNTSIKNIFITNTYNMWYDESFDGIMKKMLKNYNEFWTDNRLFKAKNIGLSKYEIYTLASIVKCETIKMTDAPKIAGVYLNRLNKHIKLQADPTAKYSSGDLSAKRITNKHTSIESPYNTYKNYGLPPGPICFTGSDFIDAVLNYTEHNYIFFCANPDMSGYSVFSVTYQEHLNVAKNYHKSLNDRNIK